MNLSPRDAFVEVPGGRVFTCRWTPVWRGSAPLVLLHDSLGSVAQWRGFPADLAAATGREVVAYDRLGFGQSSPRSGRPSDAFIEEEAQAVFPALRRALGLGAFALFGHSVGGGMALAIAGGVEGCEAVITESAQAFVEARTRAGIRAARDRFEDPAHFARLAKWHGDRARWVLEAWTEVWLSPAFEAWSLEPHLGRVRCPVLALHGDRDEFGSEAFPRRIAEGVAGRGRAVVLADCGHLPHRERPAEVLRLVADFLARPAGG